MDRLCAWDSPSAICGYVHNVPSGSKPPPGRLSRSVSRVLSDTAEGQGVTDTALAKSVGISRSQVSKYMRGDLSPTIDEIERMCKALGIDAVDTLAVAQATW